MKYGKRIALIIISFVTIVELLIIVTGGIYLFTNYPQIFAKPRNAIMVIDIRGELISTQFGSVMAFRGKEKGVVTSADNIVRYLDYYNHDDNIKAFILDIDSNGGSGEAAEEIIEKIHHMKKPVVAVIRDSALSSGYYVATGTARIFAQKGSGVGDIGVVHVEVNRSRNGTEQVCIIASTPFKESYYDDCPGFDPEVVRLYRRSVQIGHYAFVEDIAQARKLSQLYVDRLADGSIYYGIEAVDLGLIDEIGGISAAVIYLENITNTTLETIYLRDILNFNAAQTDKLNNHTVEDKN
jgi:protease-4